MPRHRPRRSRVCSPRLETLESRRLRAQFGVPWHQADHLTVSFVPDGTSVAGAPSGLFRALDSQQPTADWQQEILRAFQTWAAVADINFAVVPDGGQPLGTPGPDQGDPRFGDIRIAAEPMSPEVLAVSVPHDPFLSGTWSGDILLNDAAPAVAQPGNLFPVLLHEIGHVLGLDDSSDPTSVMFPHLHGQTTLAPADIAAVQALYQTRDDDLSGGPGGGPTPWTAVPMPEPAGYDGTTPVLFYDNLSSIGVSDFYSLTVPDGYDGPLTVRLQTAGVSLLEPHLTVLDPAGQVVGDLASTALGGDTLQAQLPYVRAGQTYTVEVRGATNDIFGIGEYVVAASFDARSTVGPQAIDQLARQSYSYLSPNDIQAIFLDPISALFHVDAHTNDTFATAEYLAPAGLYGSEAPDRITASLGDSTDVDVYHIETPDEDPGYGGYYGSPLVMTVTVRATQVNGIMPTVAVFDEDRNPVPALVLAHGDGTFTIQVSDVQPGSDYFVRVSGDPTSGQVVGNYDLDVEYGHTIAAPASFVEASLDGPGHPRSYRLVVSQTQLFDLLLSATAQGASGAAAVQMVLTDGQGRVVAERFATAGQTAGGDPVLLPPGVYQATFLVIPSATGSSTAMSFRLYGASLTDPIGPALENTTLRPTSVVMAGDLSAAALPILGSGDAPFYWLALSLGERGATGPGAGPAFAATGAGPLPPPAVTFITVGSSTSDDPAAPQAGASGITPPSAALGDRPLSTRVPTSSALAVVSLTAPLLIGAAPVAVGPDQPGDVGLGIEAGGAQILSGTTLGEALGSARLFSTQPSASAPDAPPALGMPPVSRLAPPDFGPGRAEAGIGPDLVQSLVIVVTTALVYRRLHFRPSIGRLGVPVRPLRACPPFMRARVIPSLNFCAD